MQWPYHRGVYPSPAADIVLAVMNAGPQTRFSTMYFRGNDIKSPHIVILLSFDSIVNTIIR